MKDFSDKYGNKIELSFSKNSFANAPGHVLVLCQYCEGWGRNGSLCRIGWKKAEKE